MPNPTRRRRQALMHFLHEKQVLFEHLEHDRLTPLSDDLAHRGRAALFGALRLLSSPSSPSHSLGGGTKRSLVGGSRILDTSFPDTGPLMPVELFVALAQITEALKSEFREPPQPLAKIYPRPRRLP